MKKILPSSILHKLNIRIYLCLGMLLLINTVVTGQVGTYNFMQGVFTDQSQYYVPGIASPNSSYAYQKSLYSPNSSANPLKVLYTGSDTGTIKSSAIGNGYPIGFDFVYNGESFDRVLISGNGYIKLGRSGQSITIENDTLLSEIFDGTSNNQNIISSFQVDASLYPNNNTPFIFMYGVPGNRTFVVQFSDVSGGIILVHQIQLMEKNNIIGFAYPSGGLDLYNVSLQGAIGFTTSTTINNLKITTGTNTWQTAIVGSSSTDLCDFNNSALPPGVCCTNQSFMYIWTPSAPTPAAPTCPFTYFLSATPSTFPNKDTVLYGGATTTYSTYTYYVSANGATIAPNNPTISWSDESVSSHQTTTYDIYLDTDNPPLNPIAQNLTTTSYTLPTLAPNTRYYYDVVAKNASGKDSACVGDFTTDSMPQYCETSSSGDAYINNLDLNTLSFTLTPSNESIEELPPISPYTTTLKRDTNYTCSVTLIGQHPYPGNPWSSADVRIWIDFNQDGDFDDPGEAIAGGSGGVNGSFSFSIPIPDTAKLGKTVMRVASKNVAALEPFAPCSTYSDGGNQDFVITIGPSSGCENLNLDPIINNIICHGQNNGNINLNLSGGAIPYNIAWTDGNSTSEVRSNLPKGVYQASVLDANNCQVNTPPIAIIQPSSLQVDTATTNNITYILSSGGTAPYTYLWSNGDTLSNSSNLTSGTYSITVTDAHSCDTTIQNIIIKATSVVPPPPPITPPPTDSIRDSSVNIVVYPNPTSGIIYLKSQTQQMIHLEIVSEQGKMMKEEDYNISTNNAAFINIASFARGIYFLKIIGDKSTKIVKILKE